MLGHVECIGSVTRACNTLESPGEVTNKKMGCAPCFPGDATAYRQASSL